MSSIEKLLEIRPYSADPKTKAALLHPAVQEAMAHHFGCCAPFRRFCESHGYDPSATVGLAELPFLPVKIFKRLDLRSATDIVRVLSSSATSSQIPSRVAIDDTTRRRQMRSLVAILSDIIGGLRRPFVVLDAPPPGKGAAGDGDGSGLALSARIAGLRGYLLAASDVQYVLSNSADTPRLDVEKLRAVAQGYCRSETPICLLGYTYMLYKQVVRPMYDAGIRVELPRGTFVLHFGGWKRLRDEAVDKSTLNNMICEVFGISAKQVRDIYGFTEQLGVIYPDDEAGVKRTPVYSEVIVRDPLTMRPLPDGQIGLLQFITPLPHSYPGVSLVLDDMGRIVTREPSGEGRCGTGFEVTGRAVGSEIRGCGDTLPDRIYAVAAR